MGRTQRIFQLARECGFELAGVAPAAPAAEFAFYLEWLGRGMAGNMDYLAGRRAGLRLDPRNLLPAARSVLCVAKLYNGPQPYSIRLAGNRQGWISRYATVQDYHATMRTGLEALAERMRRFLGGAFEWKICVDTSPLLERSFARLAGIGWIGKNTCLINQGQGSWFFLAELLTSLELEPGAPPPGRCGTCSRCIDACPTRAIVPTGRTEPPHWTIDSRLCISYLTIELRGAIPPAQRAGIGNHVFGCDICQDVCPWNRRAPVTSDPAFAPLHTPPLEELAALSEDEFRARFSRTPVTRARHSGFLRNVAVAMGNGGNEAFRPALERLALGGDPIAAEHAAWALRRLG